MIKKINYKEIKEITFNEYQEKLFKAFSHINERFIEENIKWFPEGGSLLGLIRENKFLDWDDDIDMLIRLDDFIDNQQKIEKIVSEVGFVVQDFLKWNNGWDLYRFVSEEQYIVDYKGKKSLMKLFIDLPPLIVGDGTKIRLLDRIYFSLNMPFNNFWKPFPNYRLKFFNKNRSELRKIPFFINYLMIFPKIILPSWYIHKKIHKRIKKQYDILKHGNFSKFCKNTIVPNKGTYWNANELELKKFKDYRVFIPKNSIEYLEKYYGKNWKQPPAKKLQKPTHILMNRISDKQYKKILTKKAKLLKEK